MNGVTTISEVYIQSRPTDGHDGASAKVFIGNNLCGSLPDTIVMGAWYKVDCKRKLEGDNVKIAMNGKDLAFAEVSIYLVTGEMQGYDIYMLSGNELWRIESTSCSDLYLKPISFILEDGAQITIPSEYYTRDQAGSCYLMIKPSQIIKKQGGYHFCI